MFSTYEQLTREQFYPISRLDSGLHTKSEIRPAKAVPTGGVVSGLTEALKATLKGKGEKLDTGKLLLLIITVLLFLEDSQNESDLLIVTAAAFILGL